MSDTNGHITTESWQIITGDKEFRDVSNYLRQVDMTSKGFDYNVVAVFGSQSTGKSTLLNRLFGTSFATMDTISRQQTTKGIWLSRAVDSNILVMDVEGTDGRERGDDQDFERKSALFSLATSEVLVVNMWETQVGLYNGANMGLLKTVFEVNLQLFQQKNSKKERSLLLFVIRDYIGTTPIENLQKTIESDLEKIWHSLAKPTDPDRSKLSDYFDLQFVGLPHKVLMPDKFEADVRTLQGRFIAKGTKEAIFKQEYHKRIPADGFSTYAKGIWEAVEANKDLDLPSQQELLAQFRCDEIATTAMGVFDTHITSTEKSIQPGQVHTGLGAQMAKALSEALAAFDLDASRYHPSVYQKKRSDLLSSMESRLLVLYRSQLAAKRSQCLQHFEKSVLHGISAGKQYDFGSLTSTLRKDAIDSFDAEAASCCVEPMTWSTSEDMQLLTTDLDSATMRLRSEEAGRVNDKLYRTLKKSFEEIIPTEFGNLQVDLWDRILLQCIESNLQTAVDNLRSRLSDLNVPQNELDASITTLLQRSWKLLRYRVSEETSESHLLLQLREHFENAFKFDKDGIPVVWKAGDDIDGAYKAAREKTLNIIPVLGNIRRTNGTIPEVPKFEEEDIDKEEFLRILSPSKQADITSRFKKVADAVYVDAKRSTVSSVASIPLYFYGLLLVLGWNELMALLRNPIYFITIIFSALVAYAVYTLNLSGPVEQVARAMFGSIIDIVKVKLRSALEISQESVPELLHSGHASAKKPSEEIGMDVLTSSGKKRQ